MKGSGRPPATVRLALWACSDGRRRVAATWLTRGGARSLWRFCLCYPGRPGVGDHAGHLPPGRLQRRIHLEAMSGAFVGGAFRHGLRPTATAHRPPELNWAFLWPVEVVLWTIAYLVASRRYQ
jgi:hypothetical protein